MTLCGKANWFLPKWLGRALPNLNIEGGEYFEERDKQAVAKPQLEPVS
jgi:hypothetical protein